MNTLVADHVLSDPRGLLNTVTAPRFVSGVVNFVMTTKTEEFRVDIDVLREEVV